MKQALENPAVRRMLESDADAIQKYLSSLLSRNAELGDVLDSLRSLVSRLDRHWVTLSRVAHQQEEVQNSDAAFERDMAELAGDYPPLPPDFSRADIYFDHD